MATGTKQTAKQRKAKREAFDRTAREIAELAIAAYADRCHRGWRRITVEIRTGNATGEPAERIVVTPSTRP